MSLLQRPEKTSVQPSVMCRYLMTGTAWTLTSQGDTHLKPSSSDIRTGVRGTPTQVKAQRSACHKAGIQQFGLLLLQLLLLFTGSEDRMLTNGWKLQKEIFIPDFKMWREGIVPPPSQSCQRVPRSRWEAMSSPSWGYADRGQPRSRLG